MNRDVDAYFDRLQNWKEELLHLRYLLLETTLVEEYKWRQPCYTHEGKNICILGSYKDNFVLSFFKGAAIIDPYDLLQYAGPNSTEGKILRFNTADQVFLHADKIQHYVAQAIEIEVKGIQVIESRSKVEALPQELEAVFALDNDFYQKFITLTPGRQRAYIMHFSGAKQSETRSNRIESYRDRIMAGKGIHDCTCGHSKRMPNCDGSHKYL